MLSVDNMLLVVKFKGAKCYTWVLDCSGQCSNPVLFKGQLYICSLLSLAAHSKVMPNAEEFSLFSFVPYIAR